jgi:hypothetical protein
MVAATEPDPGLPSNQAIKTTIFGMIKDWAFLFEYLYVTVSEVPVSEFPPPVLDTYLC